MNDGGGKALTSDEYEELMQQEVDNQKAYIQLKLSFEVRSFIVISERENGRDKTVKFTETDNPNKILLYKVIIAAYNYCYFDENATPVIRESFIYNVSEFVEWLNKKEIKNRYKVLKEYEAGSVDANGDVRPKNNLKEVKKLFHYALDKSVELRQHLIDSPEDVDYLEELRKTKSIPNSNTNQVSISKYFGKLDWLRRDDIGIGNNYYTVLYSPKLAVNSLSITASAVITETKKYKEILKCFLQDNNIAFDERISPEVSPFMRSKYIGNQIYRLISNYHSLTSPKEELKQALECVLLSTATNHKTFDELKEALDSQERCNKLFLNQGKKNSDVVNSQFTKSHFYPDLHTNWLGFGILMQLSQSDKYLPITEVESYFFSMLMASLTVQPSDIKHLRHEDFRVIKMNGKVRHIECEYFKGRAKVFHCTRSLSVSNLEGRALVTYLSQIKEGEPLTSEYQPIIRSSLRSLMGGVVAVLSAKEIQKSIETAHKQLGGIPPIIPAALTALILNGDRIIGRKKLSEQELRERLNKTESPSPIEVFGLQAIKNSAVHAFSDPYTYEYLVNYNSHSNKAEKIHYLNSDNEEWVNSSGRITREVMLDLINNVFYLDFEDLDDEEKDISVANFNSEFMAVGENISYKKGEVEARLKVVTGQEKGRVNAVGILALSAEEEFKGFSPMYVIDSAQSAWEMHNYLHEFKKNYKRLLSRNPNFLFKTALPMVEWAEYTLSKLSKKNQKTGKKLFEQGVEDGVVVTIFESI